MNLGARSRNAILATLVLGTIGSTHAAAHATLRVVTSTTDLASLAREIGGNRVEVTSLALGFEDPHSIPMNADSLLKLKRADLLIVIGLDMETPWLGQQKAVQSPVIQSANPRIRFGSPGYFDVSSFVQVVDIPTPVTLGQGIHPLGNPHYWLDPENGRRMARAIATRLTVKRPNDAAYFEQRLAAFNARLSERERQWVNRMKPYRGYKIVSYHRAWSNFLLRFGLVSVGEIELYPGIPPDDKHTDELIREMKRQNVRVILVEPPYKLHNPRRISAETGAKVLLVPGSVGGVPQATDYISLIEYNVDSLIKAFQSRV